MQTRAQLHLDLINLAPLMQRTSGQPEITVGLIDGPVPTDHPDLANENIQILTRKDIHVCPQGDATACLHGTLVAGVLFARRRSMAPAICPKCTLLVRPIFEATSSHDGRALSATASELALAIVETIEKGARVINLSVALTGPLSRGLRELAEALNYAASRGVIIVAAAGNEGKIGSTILTQHPWVIPVVAYDLQARPMVDSNLGASVGRRGTGAPGDNVPSMDSNGKPLAFGGTSAATPFVTGTVALMWSEFPAATGAEVVFAIRQAFPLRRSTVVPPLLNAWAAYQTLQQGRRSGTVRSTTEGLDACDTRA